jgi:hypothetical protein
MKAVVLALLFLMLFHGAACDALRALVEAFFGAADVLEERLDVALLGLTAWLRRPGPLDPRRALVGLFLVALAVAVAYADFTVLLASLGLIWPTDVPPFWLAFSIVGVTAAVGMLTHSVSGLWARLALTILACSLIVGQAMVAYVRTAQLAAIRSIVDVSAFAADDGTLVIAGADAAQPTEGIAKTPAVAEPERLGPGMAAGIAVILCISQVAAAWGGISFAGGVLTWVVSFPVLLVLVIPWIALRMLSASGLRGGFTLVINGLATAVVAATQLPAKIAPFPWTEASLRRRLAFRRRVLLEALQQKDESSAGSLRASIEEELREAEKDGFREFITEYARQRRTFLHDLLQATFNSARENLDHVPDFIVRMWFWPLDKAWHLMTIVGGEARFPSRKAPSNKLDSDKNEVDR